MRLKINLSNEFLGGLKWNSIGQILIRSINLFGAIILARLLKPEFFGLYSYVTGIIIFLSGLFSFSIRKSTSRNISYSIGKGNKVNTLKLTFAFLALILGFIGILIYIVALKANILDKLRDFYPTESYLIGLVIFCEIIVVMIYGILEGEKKFRELNLLAISSALLKIIFAVIFVYLWERNYALFGWIFGGILSYITVILYSFKKIFELKENLNFINNKSEIVRELIIQLKFAIPLSTVALSTLIYYWASQTYILNNYASGQTSIAYYNVANQLRSIGLYLPMIFINLSQPFLSKYIGEQNNSKFEFMDKAYIRGILLTGIVFTCIFYGLSEYVDVFYGNDFQDASITLKILSIGIFFNLYSSYSQQKFIAKGFTLKLMKFILPTAIVSYFIFRLILKFYDPYIAIALSVVSFEFLCSILFLLDEI